jgi:hypothetical protein
MATHSKRGVERASSRRRDALARGVLVWMGAAGHEHSIGTTAYILLGIWFEERDLIAQFGDQYRRYREQSECCSRA